MLSAQPCPNGVYDLICAPTLFVHILHEIVGHNTELDRILGDEMGYAGSSFAPKDLAQKFSYASPLVNIYLDLTFPEGLGTFGYDDEGVPAQIANLIKDENPGWVSHFTPKAPPKSTRRATVACEPMAITVSPLSG